MRDGKPCVKCGGTLRYENRGTLGDCVACARLAAKAQYRRAPAKSKVAAQKWAAAHPERKKQIDAKAYLKWKYGLTHEKWDALLILQSGRCWLCSRPMLELPCVDHDHETDIVRGLAHDSCNAAFGLLKEDPELFEALAEKARALRSKRVKVVV